MVNNCKTVLLLGLLTGIILFIGSLWGEQGLIMAFVLSVLMNFASYFFSDRIALAMYGARPVTREEAPRLYAIVEYLCSRAALPMPKLYIIPSDSPNAFATGRNPQHASVAITSGLRQKLNRDELQGVIAHEMSHVRNYDIRLMLMMAVETLIDPQERPAAVLQHVDALWPFLPLRLTAGAERAIAAFGKQ